MREDQIRMHYYQRQFRKTKRVTKEFGTRFDLNCSEVKTQPFETSQRTRVLMKVCFPNGNSLVHMLSVHDLEFLGPPKTDHHLRLIVEVWILTLSH